LWRSALEWLGGHNITKIQLTVASRNPDAIAFWKKVGFSDIMYRLEFNS
ncbi:MAG: GNAT family N-acetyltransferase, partial [Candidatus Thorarchaeota archaeon]